VPAPEYGYKFLDRELNRRQQSVSEGERPVRQPLNPSIRPPRQGPQQMQTRFPLNPEASSSMQYFDDADFIRGSMLPQVFEALGEQGRDDVINEIRGRRRADARRADRQQPLIDYEERVRPQETRLPFTAEFVGGEAYQDILPGLYNQIVDSNEEIKNIKTQQGVQGFRELLQKYPELDEFYRRPAENFGTVASRIDPKSFEKYKQYTDLEQKYSDPTTRKDLYNRVIKSLGDDGIDASPELAEAERLYTSGDPKLQQAGRELMMDVGVDIASIEEPAFQERRPIIGGGGYVTPKESDDIKYIRQRASDVDKFLTNMDYRTGDFLEKEFPGINRPEYYTDTERTFYSPTDFIDEIDRYDEDGYKVSVGRGVNMNRLEGLESIPEDYQVSKNAVRFLKDNPGYVAQDVIFKIGTPGEEMSYTTLEDLPENMKRPIMRYVQEASMANRRAGSMLYNHPMDNVDLLARAREQGLDEKTSSYLRAAAPFEAKNVTAPSIRGKAYTLAGYGPVSRQGDQITYINKEGKAIPLQIEPPERPLVGRVYVDEQGAFSRPAAPYSSQPRFYSTLVPGVTPDNLANLAKDIRRTPSSLAPGVADLIPSAEAVRAGYEQGPEAMGKQMAQDFAAGLPVSAALTPVLANPAVAPLAPGVGLGLVGSAAVEAADEAVRQETGEGITPKLRQFLGTERRTGIADKPYEISTDPEPISTLGVAEPRSGLQKFRDEIQFRKDLAGERFNPRRGEFGVSELIFGR